jgi:hypothetical protein
VYYKGNSPWARALFLTHSLSICLFEPVFAVEQEISSKVKLIFDLPIAPFAGTIAVAGGHIDLDTLRGSKNV